MECQKRKVICTLYDDTGAVLATGTNSCSPPGGLCARMGVQEKQSGYTGVGCNSLHAEMDALSKLNGRVPLLAKLEGHDFPCDSCRIALLDAGVRLVEVVPSSRVLDTKLNKIVRVHSGPLDIT